MAHPPGGCTRGSTRRHVAPPAPHGGLQKDCFIAEGRGDVRTDGVKTPCHFVQSVLLSCETRKAMEVLEVLKALAPPSASNPTKPCSPYDGSARFSSGRQQVTSARFSGERQQVTSHAISHAYVGHARPHARISNALFRDKRVLWGIFRCTAPKGL